MQAKAEVILQFFTEGKRQYEEKDKGMLRNGIAPLVTEISSEKASPISSRFSFGKLKNDDS